MKELHAKPFKQRSYLVDQAERTGKRGIWAGLLVGPLSLASVQIRKNLWRMKQHPCAGLKKQVREVPEW